MIYQKVKYVTAIKLEKNDFKLLKKFPVIPRLITGILLIIIGIIIQVFLPNSNGIFPFEEPHQIPSSFAYTRLFATM